MPTIATSDDSLRAKARARTLRTLAVSQVISGLGIAGAVPAGALLVMEVSGNKALSGLAQTFSVLGAAFMAIPLARLTAHGGRRAAIMSGYAIGTVGAVLAVLGGTLRLLPLLLLGTLLVGAATASNLQTRFAAVDLSKPERRARDLSLIVWTGTIGSVTGPNLLSTSSSWAERAGVEPLAGPYLFAGAMLLLGGLAIFIGLRPDPFLLSMRLGGHAKPRTKGHFRHAMALIRSSSDATLANAAIVIGHIAMVSVMVMTPVHMQGQGMSLELVGFVISGHVFGMYAFSPLMGWLADRYGRVAVIQLGAFILLTSAVISGTAPEHHSPLLALGLFLLGLGWSGTMVAGSTLLSESLPLEERPSVQGATDLLMNAAGAFGGAAAGIIIAVSSYLLLNVFAALPVMVLAVLTVRRPRPRTLTPAA